MHATLTTENSCDLSGLRGLPVFDAATIVVAEMRAIVTLIARALSVGARQNLEGSTGRGIALLAYA